MNEEQSSEFLAEVKKALSSHSRLLQDSFASSITTIHEELKDLKARVDEVAKCASESQEITNSLALASTASSSVKPRINPAVAAQVQSVDFFLKSEIISAVTISSLTRYILSTLSAQVENLGSAVLRLLLFAPLSYTRKKARKTDVGRKFVEARKKIIANMVFNCAVGFRKENSNLSCGQLRAPAWAATGFITKDHIESSIGEIVKDEIGYCNASPQSFTADIEVEEGNVQTQVAQVAKKQRFMSVSKPSVRDEIAREVIKHMWKRWTDWFSISRTEARKAFTSEIGVVFLDPSSSWKPICSSSSVEDYFDRISSLPLTEKCSLFGECYEATCSNISLLKKTKEEFPNFVITCQYNVEVFPTMEDLALNRESQHSTMRRTVNLLQVSANFLTAFFQVSTVDVFLGATKKSIHLIFVVALSFAEIVSRAGRPRVGNNARDYVWTEAKELGLLIPGDVGRLSFLHEKCLRMTEEKFNSINCEDLSKEEAEEDIIPQEGICSDDEDVEDIFM